MKQKKYLILVLLCVLMLLGGCEKKTTEITLLPVDTAGAGEYTGEESPTSAEEAERAASAEETNAGTSATAGETKAGMSATAGETKAGTSASAGETKAGTSASADTAKVTASHPSEGSQTVQVSDPVLAGETLPGYFVHICGAVKQPGVYELTAGSRVFEAVAAAGGFSETADPEGVNQALPITDGSRIRIPTAEETAAAAITGNEPQWLEEAALAKPTDGKEAAGAEVTGLVNINTAAAEVLSTLPGIGAAKAESIIAYREQQGKYSRIEDIMKVEGIKEGLFNKIKDRITV